MKEIMSLTGHRPHAKPQAGGSRGGDAGKNSMSQHGYSQPQDNYAVLGSHSLESTENTLLTCQEFIPGG